MINRPPVLLADEPTGNLDSHTSEEVLGMFQELNGQEGITIIMVTHDSQVARYAQRVVHIHDGLIIQPIAAGEGPAEGRAPEPYP